MIAVIVINFNKALDTIECLESLLAERDDLIVFLLENGSNENDVSLLTDFSLKHNAIELILSPENLGFAAGNNKVLDVILQRGDVKYVLFLNNDTTVERGFLDSMLMQIDRTTGTEMIAARLMNYIDREAVDSFGITFYKSGLASNRKDRSDPLLGPTGACALYTRELLENVKGKTGDFFDPDFFCYAEDTDLALRALLLGYCPAYADAAVVYHKGSLSTGGKHNDFILYYGIRNSLYTLVKNFPVSLLIRYSPWILLMQIGIVLKYARKAKLHIVARIYRDFLADLPAMLKKRSRIRAQCILSAAQLKRYIGNSFYEKNYTRNALFELISTRASQNQG